MKGETGMREWQFPKPAIYLISVLPALSVLAYSPFSRPGSILGAMSGVVLLQHGINVLNDVTDWNKGADVEKADSWVRIHGRNLMASVFHGYASWCLGAIVGLCALVATGKLWILALATPLAGLGFLYNHPERPIAYSRYSEWVTGLCYGAGVFGCLWLLSKNPVWGIALLGGTAYAFLSSSVLISHQPKQVLTDGIAGKNSFAVRHGALFAIRAARLLASLGVLLLVIASWLAWTDPAAKVASGLSGGAAMLWFWRGAIGPAKVLGTSSCFALFELLLAFIRRAHL